MLLLNFLTFYPDLLFDSSRGIAMATNHFSAK